MSDAATPGRPSRREFLGRAAAVATASATWTAWGGPLRGGEAGPAPSVPGLIVRNRRPLDLESPPEALDGPVTPNDLFFVRSHLGEPAVGLHPWRIEVGREGREPLSLSPEDLAGMEQVTIPAVLQCSGNGRGYFEPRITGTGWERGAVGNAEWSGVRLADVLRKAGLTGEDLHVHFLGADAPPSPKTPAYLRSLPIARALDPSTLIALRMNGEPLPVLHGGPARLAVPGWTGNHWMKWLRRITLAAAEAPGFYQQTGYRMPREPVPPGVTPKPEDLVSLTTMNVKSLIARPTDGAVLRPGRLEVRGVAWTGGDAHVTRVEVEVGNARTWREATLLGDARPYAWRPWTFAWEVTTPGKSVVRARATDSSGAVQPERPPWNKSGYLWNGYDHVTVEVRPA